MLIQMTDCIHYIIYIMTEVNFFFKLTYRVNILLKNIAMLEINSIPFEGRSKPLSVYNHR